MSKPEAAAGGLIGLLEEGDTISIDIPGHRLDVDLSDSQIEERRQRAVPREPSITTGYLARYAERVRNASTGAVLG